MNAQLVKYFKHISKYMKNSFMTTHNYIYIFFFKLLFVEVDKIILSDCIKAL